MACFTAADVKSASLGLRAPLPRPAGWPEGANDSEQPPGHPRSTLSQVRVVGATSRQTLVSVPYAPWFPSLSCRNLEMLCEGGLGAAGPHTLSLGHEHDFPSTGLLGLDMLPVDVLYHHPAEQKCTHLDLGLEHLGRPPRLTSAFQSAPLHQLEGTPRDAKYVFGEAKKPVIIRISRGEFSQGASLRAPTLFTGASRLYKSDCQIGVSPPNVFPVTLSVVSKMS